MVFASRLALLARNFSTTAVRSSQGWQQKLVPGSNLPFDINNRYKLALYFIIFFGSGLTAPMILIRHQLLKD